MNKTLPRDIRLDYAKAIAILLVLFWHLQPIRIATTEKSSILLKILKLGFTQFYLQVSLIAVPIFFLVSLYLFYQKIEVLSLASVSKRYLRIGRVYLFWTVCQFAFFYGILFIISSRDFPGNLLIPIPIHRLLMEGGPPLPIVGGSVFYFLFSLLVLVVLSTFFYWLRNMEKLFPLIGISAVLVSILYFEILNLNGLGIPYWRIENFVIYVPLSYFLLRLESEKLIRYIPLFYMGFILFSAQDIYLRGQGFNGGAYSRVSIVFGSIALLSSILKLNGLNKSKAVTFLSKYSLGIFATHKYWQLTVILIFNYYGFSIPAYTPDSQTDLRAFVIAVISILLTFSGVLIGGRTLIRKYVM